MDCLCIKHKYILSRYFWSRRVCADHLESAVIHYTSNMFQVPFLLLQYNFASQDFIMSRKQSLGTTHIDYFTVVFYLAFLIKWITDPIIMSCGALLKTIQKFKIVQNTTDLIWNKHGYMILIFPPFYKRLINFHILTRKAVPGQKPKETPLTDSEIKACLYERIEDGS